MLGPKRSALGAVSSEGKDAQRQPPRCRMIAERVYLIGNVGGQVPKSVGAAHIQEKPAMTMTATKDLRGGRWRGLNQNVRGVVADIIKDARLRRHLCLMIVMQGSVTGKEAGPGERRRGAASLVVQVASLLLISHSIAEQVSKTGRRDGLGPRRHGAAKQDVPTALDQAFNTTAMQVSQTGN